MIRNEKNQASENFCLFSVEINGDVKYFQDKSCTIDELVKRYADCNGYIPDFTVSCERISEARYAEIQQSNTAQPNFSAEFDVDNDDLIIMTPDDKSKNYIDINFEFTYMNLSDAVKYVRDNEKIPLTEDEKVLAKCQEGEKWAETTVLKIQEIKEMISQSPLGTETKGER